MTEERFVVVGASVGGLTAAQELRKLTDAEIVIVDGDPDAPYDKTALSKAALIQDEIPGIRICTPEKLHDHGITLRSGLSATGLDPRRKVVALHDGTELAYGKLLVAAGASPMVPFPVGVGTPLHVLRTLADARALRTALRRESPHLAVIGSGLVGCEVASAGRDLGVPTTLISADPGPFSAVLGTGVAAFIEQIQRESGLTAIYGARVRGVGTDSKSGRYQVELGNDTAISADVIVAGTGVKPSTAWLEGSGIVFARGILCDTRFQTSIPDVYAIGDIVCWPGGPFGELLQLEHWTVAADQGAYVSQVMVTGDPLPGAALPLPYFSTQLHGHRMMSIGFPRVAEQYLEFRDHAGKGKLLVLYAKHDRLIGALTFNSPALLARFTPMIEERIAWTEALSAAAEAMPDAISPMVGAAP